MLHSQCTRFNRNLNGIALLNGEKKLFSGEILAGNQSAEWVRLQIGATKIEVVTGAFIHSFAEPMDGAGIKGGLGKI